MLKHACNFIDRNNITKWAAEGKTAVEIGRMLSIHAEAVAQFMPDVLVAAKAEVAEVETVAEVAAVTAAPEVETDAEAEVETAAEDTAEDDKPRRRRRNASEG